jgi:hypothetical protein
MAAQIILELVLNSAIAILLVATIVYCWKLNNRIRTLQDSKGELAQLIRQFDETTEKASATIAELQTTSKKVVETMQSRLEKANFLADDLSFMIERGNKLADSLEGNLTAGRGGMRQSPAPSAPASAPVEPAGRTPSAATQARAASMTSALRDKMPPATPPAAASETKNAAALNSVLERMANRSNGVPGSAPSSPQAGNNPAAGSKPRSASVRLRSKAEQELLDALKSSR